jgi:hypothetical protein
MNTVGLFAGRGDVVLAMVLALVVGVYLGYQLRRLIGWVGDKTFSCKKRAD